jgi:hypothetical protein
MAKGSKKPLKRGGGKKRAAKETQDEQVEVAVQSLLTGNMPKIRDLQYHMSQIAGYQDKARSASARVTEAKKKAKEAGVDVGAIMEVLAMKREDPLDVATRLRQLAALMSEEGLPVQIQLFEPKFGSIEEQAAAEGWQAGINGRSPDTERWPEGTPGHTEYLRRWNDAQREIVTGGKGG